MARRASSSLNPGIVIGVVVAIIGAVMIGKSFIGKKSASFGDVAKLNMEDYLENANQLRGSEYVIEGQVDQKLQWTTDRGQLVSLKVNNSSGEQFIGIEIPPKFKNLNIDVKQKYSFRVKMRQSGIAVATGVNRL